MERNLEVQVMVTEKCNLKCDYCYLKQRSGPKMTERIFSEFYHRDLSRLMEKMGCESYHLVFFGGEPLLEMDAIEEVWIAACLRTSYPMTHGKIVTNGTMLTESLAKRIRALPGPLKLSISYDGLWQDYQRGKGENDSVIDDPYTLLEYVDECHCMVTPDAINTLTENYRYFVSLGIVPDFKLVDDDIWEDVPLEKFKIEMTRLTNAVIKDVQNGKVFIPGLYRGCLAKISQKNKRICSIGKSVALFSDGSVYPCARFGNMRQFQLVSPMGDVDERVISYLESVAKIDQYEKCQTCVMRDWCTSGCLYQQMLAGGPIEELCNFYWVIMWETTRLTRELKGTKDFDSYLELLVRNTEE